MKKIVFVTNIPSPYRVDFFCELGKLCDLTVLYERKNSSERNEKWKSNCKITFKEIYSNSKPVGVDKSIGKDIKRIVEKLDFDELIISGYASPSIMILISYCKRKRIPYYLEYDGGFCKRDKFLLRTIKKWLLCGAKGHFTTCEEHKNYLLSLGIKKELIHKYPFSSIHESEIEYDLARKDILREKSKKALGVSDDSKIIVSVGQYIYRKGFDILLEAIGKININYKLFIVGGRPTSDYLSIVKRLNLVNVHFVDFKTKEELSSYYNAADLFVLPTREDIWGLVINEAMAFGLPVITTRKCIAGLEMVRNNYNGYIVKENDVNDLTNAINSFLMLDYKKMADYRIAAIQTASNYTIEKMAQAHCEVIYGGISN